MQIRETVLEAPGGSWRVAEAMPPPDLAETVQSFWETQGFVSFGYEKHVPRGSADLIFNLSGPQRMYADGDLTRATTFQRAWIAGLFDRPLYVGPAYDAGLMGTHLIAVQVPPAAVHALFGLTAHELTNRVFEAEDVFGPWIRRVWQRLGDAGSSELRFATLLAFVRECRGRLARPAPFDLKRALKLTAASRGAVRVAALCAELGISRKHLGTLFRQSVGLTPKGFARLARFRAAMARMEHTHAVDFAELALDLGFSDQAHLINDFTAFAGDPPGRFLKVRAVDGETVLYDL